MKKSPLTESKKRNQVNKKAIYWVGGILAGIIVVISVLLILGY